ncbi:hypothetical protein CMEL01_00514 [Colletotrichum melonis]|uniref:Uncharacterized protein n=1 Tax=Colletotrichum melonis TaxID=1209925 RepID=A0AAI9Y2U7_9PEZI|nr:hypothetical protein CMEL01_00514 [Colletotrichum melonis]
MASLATSMLPQPRCCQPILSIGHQSSIIGPQVRPIPPAMLPAALSAPNRRLVYGPIDSFSYAQWHVVGPSRVLAGHQSHRRHHCGTQPMYASPRARLGYCTSQTLTSGGAMPSRPIPYRRRPNLRPPYQLPLTGIFARTLHSAVTLDGTASRSTEDALLT